MFFPLLIALTQSVAPPPLEGVQMTSSMPVTPYYVNLDGNQLPLSFEGSRGPEKRDEWKKLSSLCVTEITSQTDSSLDLMLFSVSVKDSSYFSGFRLYPESGTVSYAPIVIRSTHDGLQLVFEGPVHLKKGLNRFYLKATPGKMLPLDSRISSGCRMIVREGKSLFSKQDKDVPKRVAFALRKRGQDGVHTARIPGLETAQDGSLIAVYDNRYNHWHDLPADIDVGMSRSTDGGQTWSPMRNIMDFPEAGVGDPAILRDPLNGNLWAAALWSRFGWGNTGKGLSPETTGQFALTVSKDNGRSWSYPRSITPEIKDSQWYIFFNGPGKGISLRDGTLVFPAQFQADSLCADGKVRRIPFSTIVWSSDHGETWNVGKGCQPETTEAQAIELEDGSVMLNCRNDRIRSRAIYTTSDLGQTWIPHKTHEKTDAQGGLREPRCQASLIRAVFRQGTEPGILLFSNPDTTAGRKYMTIKASIDDGASWPVPFRILLDEESGQYSCMTLIDPQTVGILYEGTDHILTFMRIPLSEFFE